MSDDERTATIAKVRDPNNIDDYVTMAYDLADECERQASELVRLRAERDALQAFKEYVHKRFDDAGVPVDPESSHKLEGCRIGGRLDIVLGAMSEREALAADRDRLDWLENCMRANQTGFGGTGDMLGHFHIHRKPLRQAIDAARGEQK